MAQHQLVRTYKMADADLIQTADTLKNSVLRDTTDFETRAVDLTRISTFSGLRDAFSDFPTDEELQGAVTVASEAKDAKRTDLEKAIRAIRNMAELQYKKGGMYKTFDFDDITHRTDNELIRMAKRVHRVASRANVKADLATRGLTTSQLSALSSLALAFDNAVDAVDTAVEDRDIQTQDRIKAGNDLFADLTELASVGKSLYEDTNEAKYNDYVITDAPPPAELPGS